MNSHSTIVAIVLCVMLPVAACGCSIFRGACASVLPVITVAQSYIHDATIAVDQAEAVIKNVPISDAAKKHAEAVILQARQALRAADTTIRSASSQCQSFDPVTLLRDFVTIWGYLEPLLAQHSQQLGVAHGGSVVSPPAVVLEARARGQK